MELKPGYKQSEAGEIPEDWVVHKLGSISTFLDGMRRPVKSSDRARMKGSIPYYGASGIVDYVDDYIFDEELVLLGEDGENILSRNLPLAFRISGKAWVNNHAHVIRPNPGISIGFLTEYLESLNYESLNSGTAQPKLNKQKCLQIPVALPSSSEEQRAIATALSDADALLDGLDRLITKKRDLKQAAMQALLSPPAKTAMENGELKMENEDSSNNSQFSTLNSPFIRLPGFEGEWEAKRLGELAEIVMGQSPSSSNYNSRGDGLPLIQGNADIVDRKTIKRIFTTQITKRGRGGDVLMSVRAPVGEISRALFDVCLGRGVCALRFPNDFLYHYLIFLEPSWAKHSKGSTFDSVNSADVKAVEINLPLDATEQEAIAQILSDMDAEIAALEQRRNKTKDIKQAMMQELLTGRTRLI